MTTPDEFFGMHDETGATAGFSLGREMHGAFGGVFGGAVAACCLLAARRVAEDRVPYALDCRFVSRVPEGNSSARALVLAQGQTTTTVQVALAGPEGGMCAMATVSFVDAGGLVSRDVDASLAPPAGTYADAVPWTGAHGLDIPILDTLAPRALGNDPAAVSSAVKLPWEPDPAWSAESACLIADLCVGPPVAAALDPAWVPHPNPDLSLRFVGAELGEEVYGTAGLARIVGGIAAVQIAVHSRRSLLAIGVSTSLLVGPGPDSEVQ